MAAAVAQAVAAERLRIIATLTRVTADWDLAEDCLSDGVERALTRWPRDGIPDNPAAWLTTTARHRALDLLRRRRTEEHKLQEVRALAEREVSQDVVGTPSPYDDDRLRLLFACCHPALPLAGRVALTLKTVTGLSTREVARAFLVSEATMGQRLLRTRNKIAHAGISFRVPEPHRLAERTSAVLAVIYLLFNEGYSATEGETLRDDLAREAVQLAELVAELLPDDDEAHGLEALLRLQHARRDARTDTDGDLVTMEEQDRSRWDHAETLAGLAGLARARSSGRPPGYYRLQAEIAALHATAADAASTDWPRIVTTYDALGRLRPSPVLALNRAVAVSYRDGPQQGLAALADLEVTGGLEGYPLLPAVRADFLRRAGLRTDAAASYRLALAVARTAPEHRLLERRLRELEDLGGSAVARPHRGRRG